ncbi:MAG: hypothetical protein HKL87_01150 [Acidimicrobiaceae bacterium]|nr:hypothetical protein [Acidimicrobiaceae bacterium]
MSRTHFAGVFDALYEGLARASQSVYDEGVCVRLFVASRVLGALALEARGSGEVVPHEVVTATLEHALSEDEEGYFTLYVFTMVIGPRLLVSLRDDLERGVDEPTAEAWAAASDAVIGQMNAISAFLRRRSAPETPSWAPAARALVDTLESAGYSDHLGPIR